MSSREKPFTAYIDRHMVRGSTSAPSLYSAAYLCWLALENGTGWPVMVTYSTDTEDYIVMTQVQVTEITQETLQMIKDGRLTYGQDSGSLADLHEVREH